MEPKYIFFIIVGALFLLFLILVIASKSRIFRVYKKYLNEENFQKITGKEFAISTKNHLKLDINLALIDGTLTDCYSAKSKTLLISEAVSNSNSISSISIIAHEFGHAVQDHDKNPLFIIVNLLQKITRFTSKFILLFFIAGLITLIIGIEIYSTLFIISLVLFGLELLKNLLIIPLEIGASKFAYRYLNENKYLTFKDKFKVKKLLRVASQTYIANFFDSLLPFKFKRRRR